MMAASSCPLMVAGAAETFSNRTQSAPSVQFEQVDLDHLKKTLVQLGYTADQDKTSIPPEAATLVHRILADLQQAALQYALLAERQQDFPKKDYIDFSGLLESNGGASFLANSSTLGLVDESFMLQAVETARSQIDSLQDKIKELEFKLQSESCSSQTKKAEEDESRRKIESLESSLRDKESRSQTAESNLINFKKNFLEKIERPIVLLSQFAIQSLHAPLGSAYAQRIVHPETLSVRLSSSSGEDPDKIIDEGAQSNLELIRDVVEKISRDAESQKNAVNEMRASMDRMCVEAQVAAEQIARYKRDNSLLMNQVSELQSRTQRKEFEASINVDIESQVRKMNAIGDLIKNKLTQLESFSGNSDSSKTESESTLKTLIDAISGELSTEIGFAGHLSQLVDKLNKRRADQDSAIADVEKRLRDAEARVLAQETERVELTGRLVRLQAELSTREQSNSASGESVRALQEALNAKQQRLDQHKTHCSELKAALDQCRAGMNSMRKNEEAIRRHVSAQDEEIRNLRSQTEGGTNDRNRLARQVGELTGELSIRSEELLRRTDEVKRHSKEAQEAQRALEKLTSIFKQKEVRVKELEEGLLKRRREKDMLMVTYCRVIKENERLSAELKSHASSDNAATNDGASIQAALQVRAQFQQQEIERLRGQISALESKNQETLQQLSDAIKSKDLSEEELRERSRELSQARAVINTLEKSKKELASQTARFGQQAAELRSHVRRLEGERTEVTRKLNAQITAQGPINNEIDLLRSQLAEAEKFRNLGEAALRKEKENIQRLESKSREERRLRIERENALQSLEAGRARLTRQIDILNREHEKAVSFIQKNSLKQYNDADKDELDENISKDANRKDFNATSRDHDANLDDWVPFDDQSHNYGVPSSAYAVDKNKNAIGSTIVDEYHSESEFDGTSKFIPVGTNFDSASDFKRGVRNEFSQIDRGEVIRSKNKASSQDINMTTNLFRSDNFDDDRKTIFRGVEETRNSYYVPSDVHQTPNYRPTPSYTHDRRPLGNYSPSRNGTEPFSIDLANDLENDDERINSLNSEYIEKTNFDDGDGDDDDGDRRWLPQSESTDRLRLQNQTIRRQIAEIREEIKEGNMTPLRTNSRVDFGNEESSIMSESSLTIDDDDQRDDNSLNGTEDSFSTLANNFLNKNGSDVNAEMKRRLEKENRLLNRIVGKVRAELMRATVETPGSSSSSATS